jgi:hypothetical protein
VGCVGKPGTRESCLCAEIMEVLVQAVTEFHFHIMMSFLLVANIGRRDFGWLVCGGGFLVSCLMWRWFGVFLGGEVVFCCAVYRRWVFNPPPLFLSFSSPFLPHLCVRRKRFRFSHPPAPFRTISDV